MILLYCQNLKYLLKYNNIINILNKSLNNNKKNFKNLIDINKS